VAKGINKKKENMLRVLHKEKRAAAELHLDMLQ